MAMRVEVRPLVEIGGITPQEWPWMLARTGATAWAQLSPVLQQSSAPERVASTAQQSLLGVLSQPPNGVLVARVNGRPVGYLVVTFLPDELTGLPTALFYDIFVEPAYRGQGVSSRLTAAGEAYCRSLGVRLLRRYISATNEASLRHAVADGCQPERIGFVKLL